MMFSYYAFMHAHYTLNRNYVIVLKTYKWLPKYSHLWQGMQAVIEHASLIQRSVDLIIQGTATLLHYSVVNVAY